MYYIFLHSNKLCIKHFKPNILSWLHGLFYSPVKNIIKIDSIDSAEILPGTNKQKDRQKCCFKKDYDYNSVVHVE